MAHLLSCCKSENLAWKNGFSNGYHISDGNNRSKTVIDYPIPLPKDIEDTVCTRYNIAPDQRKNFYQSWLECIQREIAAANYLKSAGVKSILTFTKVEQEQDENKIAHVLMETEDKIWPVVGRLFSDTISAMSLIDVTLRLALVLRDINKDPVNMVHRGVDLNEVYINSEDKILLGGFFYADIPGKSSSEIPYLPCASANFMHSYSKEDEIGQNSDIKALSIIAWNLFSGNPHDAHLSLERLVKPEYAPTELADILVTGIMGLADNTQCNVFRRSLLNCRKMLNKTDYVNTQIPIRHQPTKQIRVDLLSSVP